jgi:hypothetical protein
LSRQLDKQQPAQDNSCLAPIFLKIRTHALCPEKPPGSPELSLANFWSQHIEPFNRPLLPKQQSSKKFFAMIEILNQFILPKFVNNTTSFKKLHSIIYSGALTIIRLNGSKEIGQTNNIKTKELPKWEQRLNKRINNIRRDLGRITQYLKGINSNHLNN